MPSFTSTIFAAAALISTVSASPIMARDVCGAAPTGTTSQTPLSQPTGITTAALCMAQCTSQSSCQSFMFGLVDGVDTCILYSVAASSLPAQTNLVAYDKACTSVPSVEPTTSNPTGVETSDSSNTGTTDQNSNSGSTTSTDQNQNSGSTDNQQTSNHKMAARDTCGSAPAAASGNAQPIAQPSGITSAELCKEQCKVQSGCQSFTFGDNTCKLFNVAAASVPTGSGSAVYDVGCSI